MSEDKQPQTNDMPLSREEARRRAIALLRYALSDTALELRRIIHIRTDRLLGVYISTEDIEITGYIATPDDPASVTINIDMDTGSVQELDEARVTALAMLEIAEVAETGTFITESETA